MDGLANLIARHPETTFIGAHVGCYAENLEWVGQLLDRCSNFYVDAGFDFYAVASSDFYADAGSDFCASSNFAL